MPDPQLEQLKAEYAAAVAAYEQHDTNDAIDTEQRTRDALVDYVEAHGYNGTEHDPRGTWEEHDAIQAAMDAAERARREGV